MMKKNTFATGRRWLVALALAGLFTAATVYLPLLNAVAYACQSNGGGC